MERRFEVSYNKTLIRRDREAQIAEAVKRAAYHEDANVREANIMRELGEQSWTAADRAYAINLPRMVFKKD